MTQLIENKPRRHALIATLSHFYPSRSFVGRSFSSDITRDARSAYRCADSIAACIRTFDRSSKSRICNRRKSAIFSLTQNDLQLPLEIAFLIDRGGRLEIDVTPRKQREATHSNRRWIRGFTNRFARSSADAWLLTMPGRTSIFIGFPSAGIVSGMEGLGGRGN